jgi:hypothetical protein
VGACAPVTGAGSGGKGGIAWGGRSVARRQAIDNGSGASHGGAGARGGDVKRRGDGRVGRAGLIHRGLEEEEARLLFFEVRGSFFCGVWFFGAQAF